jgi:two-component system invasion response regulator UvrY
MSTPAEIRIALADDHAILRKGLAELINSMHGLKVVIDADNGEQLLEKLKSANLKPDVCILDINMPDMNGYETAAAIREEYPDINILALSMYDSEFNIIKMLRAGAQGYLLKNVSPTELQKAVTDVCTHGFYHSELVTGRMLRMLHDRKNGKSELNENEEHFLAYCCTELTYKEIADKMFKSPRTIDGYREDLFTKLGITSRTGLVLYALKTGIARM